MKKKGLTLLEVLIATILFSLVISGLANIFVAAKRYTQHNRAYVTAAEISRRYLEPLNAEVVVSKYSGGGLGGFTWNPTTIATLGPWTDASSQTIFTPSYAPPATGPEAMDLDSDASARTSEIHRVSIRIQWNERTAQ